MTVRMRSVPNGPGIVSAPFDEVLAALRRAPDPSDWTTVGDLVVPVFPRRRPFSFDGPEPLRVRLPPGVLVGFGIDIGPAFAFVTGDMLEGWPVTVDGLTAVALANLRETLEQLNRAFVASGLVPRGRRPTRAARVPRATARKRASHGQNPRRRR